MILDPLKRAQKFFEVDPSFASKVMRLLVFAYCETPPGLNKFSKKIFFWSFQALVLELYDFLFFPLPRVSGT